MEEYPYILVESNASSAIVTISSDFTELTCHQKARILADLEDWIREERAKLYSV